MKVAHLLEDLTHMEQMRLDSIVMLAIFRNYSIAALW